MIPDLVRHTNVLSIVGDILKLRGSGVGFGDLAVVENWDGRRSLGQVIELDRDVVSLQVFSGGKGLSTQAKVTFLGHPTQVTYSPNILGRVFRGSGKLLDGGPDLSSEPTTPIGGPSVNPKMRIVPQNMIHTQVPMIDVFNSLVVSQKLPIFSISGEPYNQVLARIALQAEVDMIVLGGMGLKYDDYLYFRHELENGGALSRSIFFVHTSADPAVECLQVPDICLSVAEQFALHGKNVLVLLTDMTNFADAMKEIAITMEQVPSNRGYPGDLYTQLARRYEKAVDFEGAGSVTVLAVSTMPGDDVTHPVPDNTGYITEGQFYLHGGRIDPFGSLSRLKQLVNSKTREDHRALMDGMIQLYAQYKETLEKRSMGFRMSAWDSKLLEYGELFESEMMDLSVNIPLEQALDLGWEIMAKCFEPDEVNMRSELLNKFWPKDKTKVSKEVASAAS